MLGLVLLTALVAPAQAEWHALKEVTSVENLSNGVELGVGEARVRITALSAQVVRLRFTARREPSLTIFALPSCPTRFRPRPKWR